MFRAKARREVQKKSEEEREKRIQEELPRARKMLTEQRRLQALADGCIERAAEVTLCAEDRLAEMRLAEEWQTRANDCTPSSYFDSARMAAWLRACAEGPE